MEHKHESKPICVVKKKKNKISYWHLRELDSV